MFTRINMAGNVVPTELRVFIVEDDPAVGESIAQLLRMHDYLTSLFDSAETFLAAAQPDWTGCIIIDIRLPGLNGLDLQASLAGHGINLPVIIITGHGDTSNSRTAFKAGAVDFLEKPIDPDALLEMVATAVKADVRRNRKDAEHASLAGKLERLTARENEVLDLLLEGKHSREIAETLAISPRTVEVYKSRLMEKLQVARTNDLLRLIIAYRLSTNGKPPAS